MKFDFHNNFMGHHSPGYIDKERNRHGEGRGLALGYTVTK